MIDQAILAAATKAVEIYAATHPRPPQVIQVQAAEMVGVSVPTIRKMVRAGNIRLNKFGLIPIGEVDAAIAARRARAA